MPQIRSATVHGQLQQVEAGRTCGQLARICSPHPSHITGRLAGRRRSLALPDLGWRKLLSRWPPSGFVDPQTLPRAGWPPPIKSMGPRGRGARQPRLAKRSRDQPAAARHKLQQQGAFLLVQRGDQFPEPSNHLCSTITLLARTHRRLQSLQRPFCRTGCSGEKSPLYAVCAFHSSTSNTVTPLSRSCSSAAEKMANSPNGKTVSKPRWSSPSYRHRSRQLSASAPVVPSCVRLGLGAHTSSRILLQT